MGTSLALWTNLGDKNGEKSGKETKQLLGLPCNFETAAEEAQNGEGTRMRMGEPGARLEATPCQRATEGSELAASCARKRELS